LRPTACKIDAHRASFNFLNPLICVVTSSAALRQYLRCGLHARNAWIRAPHLL